MSGGRGAGGYPGPGYGGAEYEGDDAGGNQPRDDSVWQRDQPEAWADPAGYGQQRQGQQQGYGQQGYGPQGYSGPGYGGQDYDGPGYAGQRQAGQRYPDAYPGQGYQDRSGAPSAPQQYPPSAYPGSGPYPAQPGQQQRGPATGARPVQRGSGSLPQVPPGYDQRGTGGQRMAAGGYDDPRRDDQGGDSFVPGFGSGDDFEAGRGQDRRRRGRQGGRDQGADNGYNPRRRDPGYPDGPGYSDETVRTARSDRADTFRQEARRGSAGRGPDGRGPDPRARRDASGGQGGRDGRDAQGGRGGRGTIDRDPRRRGQGGGDDWQDPRDREAWSEFRGERRRRSPIRRLAPWIALLVIVVPLALVGWHIYGIWKAKTHPADYAGGGTSPAVTVQVLSGETADQLSNTLYADGVVASTRAFVLAAENSSDPTGLEPGYFTLNHHMQASLAWAALLNPKNRVQTVVTIPEGKRASQVIAIMAQQTKIPLKDFEQVIAHPAQLGLPSYADGKVEGFLFPATYTIVPHETALQILQAMVARYNVEAQQIDLQAAADKIHLSARDVIIEASMAQAEGGSVSDYPKIARVIINRLNIHMALQFDSVLLYGLNKYAVNVTDAQVATPGPYNDFEHAGLPPGPISNPGNAAIQAILHPATGDWLYFLTYTNKPSQFSASPLKGQ